MTWDIIMASTKVELHSSYALCIFHRGMTAKIKIQKEKYVSLCLISYYWP